MAYLSLFPAPDEIILPCLVDLYEMRMTDKEILRDLPLVFDMRMYGLGYDLWSILCSHISSNQLQLNQSQKIAKYIWIDQNPHTGPHSREY